MPLSMAYDKEKGLQLSYMKGESGQVLMEGNYNKTELALTKEQLKGVTGREGPARMYIIYTDSKDQVVGIRGEGGFRATTGNLVLKETAHGGGVELQKIDPETGKVVREHIESGRDRTQYNENKYMGVYRDRNGQMYYANIQYAKGSDGKLRIISGTLDNLIRTNEPSIYETPDGKMVTGVQQKTESPQSVVIASDRPYAVGKIPGSHSARIKLSQTLSVKDTVDYDKSRRFTGGYIYQNYLSAFAQEKGWDRTSQALGKGRGVVHDVREYIMPLTGFTDTLRNTFTRSDNNKVVYMPYEATAILGSVGSIRDMFGPASQSKA